MKEFIENEKRRIEENLRWFNELGCRLYIDDFIDTVPASLTVTRIAPHFSPSGEHLKSDFWLLWKEVGYQEGFQYSHTIKVVDVEVEDEMTREIEGKSVKAWIIVKMVDSDGRVHRFELIVPNQEKAQADLWKDWLAYRNQNKEFLEKLDEEILRDHLKIAEEWE